MAVQVFQVNLDNPSRKYYSQGESITGNVFLRVLGDLSATEISVRFSGCVNIFLAKNEVIHYGAFDQIGTFRNTAVPYTGEEDLFDMVIRVFVNGQNTSKIPSGDNRFPFSFQLPQKALPSNCTLSNGRVFYGLQTTLSNPWLQLDLKYEVLPVTTFTKTDLNNTTGAENPVQIVDESRFGCCWKSRPCILQSFTPTMGFCPGESIPFSVEIINQSDRSISNLRATFTQMWTLVGYNRQFTLERGRLSQTFPIDFQVEVYGESVASDETRKWDMNFIIPVDVPPTPSAGVCQFVDLDYMINVNAQVKECCCCDTNIGLTHPIMVGTVPLK